MRRRGVRDKAILDAFETGVSVSNLALQYALKINTIVALLRAERLRREVCPDPGYKALRRAGLKPMGKISGHTDGPY
jgi:hypothetical protein